MTTSRHFVVVRVAIGRINTTIGALDVAGYVSVRRVADDGTVPEGLALVEVEVLTNTPGRFVDDVAATLRNAGVPFEHHYHGSILGD